MTAFAYPVTVTFTVQGTGLQTQVGSATPAQFAAVAVHVGLRGAQGIRGLKGDTGDVHPQMPVMLSAAEQARDQAQGHAAQAAASASTASDAANDALAGANTATAKAAEAQASAAAAASYDPSLLVPRAGGVTLSGHINAMPGASGAAIPQVQEVAPPGMVAHFPRSSAPAGWLKANGAAVSRTSYAALFGVIGTTFGAGDGVTTFKLPDLRGEFLRCLDDGRGVDASRAMGSAQAQAIQAHNHSFGIQVGSTGSGVGLVDGQNNSSSGTPSTSNTGGTETRPRNIALLACIKF